MKILDKFPGSVLVVFTMLLIGFTLWWADSLPGQSIRVTSVFAAGPAQIDLLSAEGFVILAKTGITNTGSHTTDITGDIGSSPITAAAMDNVFCSEITGTIYGVDAAYTGSGDVICFAGTPADKTTVDDAILDMETAYTAAAGVSTPDGTELYAGNLGGQTFAPGLYKWSTDVTIPTSVTLAGGANDVWIFQIAGNLEISSAGDIASGIKVLLSGGAEAANIFWQVGGVTGATLGTYSTFNGNILSAKQVIIQTGAVLNGRALAQTQVTLDANTIAVPDAVPAPATLEVIKLVVNGNGGTAVPSDFIVHVKESGVDVAGSPIAGVSAPGTVYSLAAGTYVISEDANASYAPTFSGDCDETGSITLEAGDDKICTLINTDIPVPVPEVVTSSGGGGGGGSRRITPHIGVLKVPTPLALLGGAGQVTYDYTVWNVGGRQALVDVSLVDDKCSPITFLSGDLNGDDKLDEDEEWTYRCVTNLATTTMNTAVATGYGDDSRHQVAIATAIATVVVGVPSLPDTGIVTPPLIDVVVVPSQLTPLAFGGDDVLYTYSVTNPGVVPMHNVVVLDNRCGPVSGPFGDLNRNQWLDPGESWSYACQTRVPVSTQSIVTAVGWANGLIALDYAFTTVLVATPGLPNTGLPPESLVESQ